MFPVLIPTETINRELDYQLFLAAHMAQRGARVFVGHPLGIHAAARYMRGGLLIGKACEPFFPTADQSRYEDIKRHDIVAVHLDEEGAIFLGDEEAWKTTLARRLDVHRIAKDDVVCVWGRFQKAFYESQGGPQPVHITGHPRFDLYREKYRPYFAPLAKDLNKRFGDFVLLNTNLSTANNGLGLKTSFTKRFLYDPDDPKARWEALRYWAHSSRILIHFVELIHRLSDEFPGLRIIVRPHPSESHEYYRIVTSGLPNVTVIHEGSVAPWLFGAKAIIHDGCTTGVEAWLGEVPVINYKALADDRYDLPLPNHYGSRATTADEVVGILRDVVAGRPPDQRRAPDPVDAELMINFEQESFPLLLDAIDSARSKLGRSSYWQSPHQVHAQVAERVEKLVDRARQLSPLRRRTSEYAHQKFYGMKNAGVADRMRRIGDVTGMRPKWTLLSDWIVAVEPV